ncbi:MAG: AAA family ATPase [Acidobacteriota bacterium]
MLGILEVGSLRLGDNAETDFTRSIVVLTSNVGTREMTDSLERRTVGFIAQDGPASPPPSVVEEVAQTAARELFPLEFLNRLDEILVYSPLTQENLERIFDKFLRELHQRAINQAGVSLLIKVGPEARKLILERGTDLSLGARPLRRAIEVELVDPLSRLIASQGVQPGDVLDIEREEDRLVFYRQKVSSGHIVV